MDSTLNQLASKKNPFLNQVEQEINSYIVRQGAHCIDIVERDCQKEDVIHRKWRASVDIDFCEVLYKFVRHKQLNGHKLDSALTEPVCEIVTKKYEEFYKDNADAISKGVLAELTGNDLILESFLSRLTDKALKKASSKVRKQVVHLIVHQIHDSAAAGTLNTVGSHIGHIAANSAATSVGAIVVHVLIKLLATHISVLVTKLLSTALIHNIVLILVKKVIIVAVGTAVFNFLAAHVAAAAGGASFMWIVLPLLAAYIAYRITTFPEKIGKEVSKSVRQELSDRFLGMNRTILERIKDEVLNGEKLVEALAGDKELIKLMEGLAQS